MAQGHNQETSLVEDNHARLKREIEDIRTDLSTDLTELRSRMDKQYIVQQAVAYLADRAGTAFGTSLGLLRRFRKRTAA